MTKENVLKDYKKAMEDGNIEYAESLKSSWETSWPEEAFPEEEKKEKSKKPK